MYRIIKSRISKILYLLKHSNYPDIKRINPRKEYKFSLKDIFSLVLHNYKSLYIHERSLT